MALTYAQARHALKEFCDDRCPSMNENQDNQWKSYLNSYVLQQAQPYLHTHRSVAFEVLTRSIELNHDDKETLQRLFLDVHSSIFLSHSPECRCGHYHYHWQCNCDGYDSMPDLISVSSDSGSDSDSDSDSEAEAQAEGEGEGETKTNY